MAANPGGVAVQILGSNDALDGNVLIANDPTTNGSGADLITGSAANTLQIDGTQFGGVGFALAYVNGPLDTYTSSQDVEFVRNKFVGTASLGTAIGGGLEVGTTKRGKGMKTTAIGISTATSLSLSR